MKTKFDKRQPTKSAYTMRWVYSWPFQQEPLPGFGIKPRVLRKRRKVMGEPQKTVKVHFDR